jgi:hypothetical protein
LDGHISKGICALPTGFADLAGSFLLPAKSKTVQSFMKILYNWILIGVFAFIIFGLQKIDIALFILVLLWLGTYSTSERNKKMLHVFQILNDSRYISLMKRLGISKEETKEMGDKFEAEELTEKQRKELYKDMDDLGM